MIMATKPKKGTKSPKKVKTSYPGDDLDQTKQEKYEEVPAEDAKKPTKKARKPVSDPDLNLIKVKLRKKYHLLRNDLLDYDDLDQLKAHVGKVLGLGKAHLEHAFLNL
jgi:hypothetical protein